ncbi:TetR/AcrR family transcriptional regulator [Mycobacterium sp. GA-2829]|uniref:TetR/AcrR family transcriptional regulator n=1 Tax=Mycobacterium sp. GA-2829 TaxID=1772283 RepID=UPI0007401A14|nr:TetR/AcrR family transcriptional regulator [Mycobacterium sp. GA-2829]KUI37076.1 TetR family transcriptional regulator [Mycobacterium sp. GA-2829]
MGAVVTREGYFETGLAVLSDQGYGGLKLAEVCHRLGVTTGSFYHYFANWSTYTRELVAYWHQQAVTRIVDAVRAVDDPHRRVEILIEEALALPHSAEAAIRVWSSMDQDVHTVQAAVDRQRFDIMRESSLEVLGDERQAEVFARWCVYILVGYEQAVLPPDESGLKWIAAEILHTLDSGRFSALTDPT